MKKFINDSISNAEFVRDLHWAAKDKNSCLSCSIKNEDCIDLAKKGKCIKYNNNHSFMLPAFSIGCFNLENNYLSDKKDESRDFFLIQKLNENEFYVSFTWTTYDYKFEKKLVKLKCNCDKLCLDKVKASKLDPKSYFNYYIENSTNYKFYDNSYISEYDSIAFSIIAHCDSWSRDNDQSYFPIFDYKDMFKVLMSPNYNFEFALFYDVSYTHMTLPTNSLV